MDTSCWPQGRNVKTINLALQGGGAHGAFTWGVLDRLLEDEGLAIEAVSGTSAGAVNGTALAYGLTLGGREGAREVLTEVWRRIAGLAALSPIQPSPLDRLLGPGRMDTSPGYHLLDAASRLFTPYLYNALDISPVRQVLAEVVDFEVLRRCDQVKLFVSATNVRRGRARVFEVREIGLDAVLASTCLPFLNQAVEIDGEPYWDGGYTGNPPLGPLVREAESRDVLLVQLNPVNIEKTPTTAVEIMDRLNTLTFNSALMYEMRDLDFAARLLADGIDHGGRLKPLFLHVIEDEALMSRFGVSSKLNADWAFLTLLRDAGRAACETWLQAHRDDLGQRSSVDIAERYL